jgi:Icc-related predicted phosphoesterase
MNFLKITVLFAITLTFTNCDNFFEYSVYEASVKTEQKNTTAKNLKLLEKIKLESQDFKFAFITDSHYFYDNFRKVIEDINKNDEILFVIVGGDMTEQAVIKEYELFYNIMKNLDKPYLTVIGNHDHKSNGANIYKKMFGDYNYSFEFNNNKFVLFDDTVWERKGEPDFNWLSNELSNHSDYKQVFTIAHIPPYGDQFTRDLEQEYIGIMEANNVTLSIHGHRHKFIYDKSPSVSYLTGPTLKDAAYCIVEVKSDSFEVILIEL